MSLPPELAGGQPYSMGPLTGWSPFFTMPAVGTVMQMDDDATTGRGIQGPPGATYAILGCLIAPLAIQREAQKRGIRGIMMKRVPGLAEALGLVVPDQATEVASEPESAPELDEAARVAAFAQALRDLEDED